MSPRYYTQISNALLQYIYIIVNLFIIDRYMKDPMENNSISDQGILKSIEKIWDTLVDIIFDIAETLSDFSEMPHNSMNTEKYGVRIDSFDNVPTIINTDPKYSSIPSNTVNQS